MSDKSSGVGNNGRREGEGNNGTANTEGDTSNASVTMYSRERDSYAQMKKPEDQRGTRPMATAARTTILTRHQWN